MGSQASLSTLHYSQVEFAVRFANFFQLILETGGSKLEPLSQRRNINFVERELRSGLGFPASGF